MSTPRWLTEADSGTSLLVYAVPLILAGSYATNRYFDATTSEGKGKILIMSGVSVLIMLGLLGATCEGSRKGVCSFVPEELR